MTELQSIFSEDNCKEILKNCFKKNYEDIKFVSHKFQSLKGDVQGFLSEHYSLIINYEEIEEIKSVKFFVKTILERNDFLTVFAKAMDVFRKESFIYTNFFPELEMAAKNYKKILPKCYFSGKNILVLEDLSQSGFSTIERLIFFNFEQCKVALKTLSYYHAYSIIYEEMKSKQTNTIFRLDQEYPLELADRFCGEYKTSPTAKFLVSCVTSLIALVNELPDDKFQDKNEFLNLLNSSLQVTDKEIKFSKKFRSTCTHGDLWSSNIMFKYNDNKLVDCKIIDFQTLRYAMPGYDVELFFYSNTTTEFRSKYKSELLYYYYESFTTILKENNIESSTILTLKELEDSCILRGPESKIQAICDMFLLLLPEDILSEAQENPDLLKSALIDDRSKYIVDVYKNHSEYRKIITDELIDLYHIIIKKENFLNSI